MFAIKTLFVVLLLSLSMAAFASAYHDPRGRFTLDVPTGWSVTATDDGALVSDGGSAYARIIKVEGGGRDPRLIKSVSDQIGMQWQNFMQNSSGDFTLSGRHGFFAFFSGINPKGVQALMRVVGAPVGEDAYIILMSFPASDINTVKTALQQIENSFTLTSGKPIPADVKPAPADTPASAPPIAARPANAAGWKEHYDDRLHVGMSLPAGWSMKTEGYTLVAQSQDHASTVLVEAFAARPGETAQAVLHSLGARHAALLAHAQVTKTAPQPNAGDTLVAALSYKNAAGKPGQARALCSVFQNSGMLYAIAAPDARFAHERDTLLQALHSLRFGPPQSDARAAADGGAAKGAAMPSNAQAAHLKFEKWTDPKESSFSVDVPTGWSVAGGANRVAATHVNQMVLVESPDKDMMLRLGDPTLPVLNEPNRAQMQLFHDREGVPYVRGSFMSMYLRYMPALQFNRWYLNTVVKQAIEGLTITKEEEFAPQARQMAEQLNKMAGNQGHVECTIAMTEFKGTNKQTNKPTTGAFFCMVQRTQFASGGSVWGPTGGTQMMLTTCDEGEGMEKRQAILSAISGRMIGSWQEELQWRQNLQQQTARATGQVNQQANADIAAAGERSKQIARNSNSARQSIMGSYWKRVGARNDMQRQQANYYGDKTDVRNPETGQTYKVASGSSYYYHDPRTGTILGTNSTTRPPVDFTPMQEF